MRAVYQIVLGFAVAALFAGQAHARRVLSPYKSTKAPTRKKARSTIKLVHLHTGERLTVDPNRLPPPNRLNRFLRCKRCASYTLMDPRLVLVAARAARHFGRKRVLIVSAFRSQEINRRMHRNSRGVALRSRHVHGQALDFRLPKVPTPQLCRYLRKRRFGGVGCYFRRRFVHVDVGPVRNWGDGLRKK
jgi:uncharacterized protein YcbK (DUF882 family)